jgi:soluble lytic murein transglycosylase
MTAKKECPVHIRTFLTCAAILVALPYHSAHAVIYQYTDENGTIHFTNVSVAKGKKYRRVAEPGETTPQAKPSPRPVVSPAAAQSAVTSTNVPSAYLESINTACDRHGVDPALVHAIMKVESDFNPYALSRKGAMGLMQLMPQTAMDMNVRNSFNPEDNIFGGVKYLRYLLDRYEGNVSLALAAYNSGETAVKRWGTIPPFPETQNYVQRIMRLYHGNGTTNGTGPRSIVYMGYGEDGAYMITDNPSNHKNKSLKKKAVKF